MNWIDFIMKTGSVIGSISVITDFPASIVTSHIVTSAGGYTGLPEQATGMLITDRRIGMSDAIFQTFKVRGTASVYERCSNTNGTGWNAWNKLSAQ